MATKFLGEDGIPSGLGSEGGDRAVLIAQLGPFCPEPQSFLLCLADQHARPSLSRRCVAAEGRLPTAAGLRRRDGKLPSRAPVRTAAAHLTVVHPLTGFPSPFAASPPFWRGLRPAALRADGAALAHRRLSAAAARRPVAQAVGRLAGVPSLRSGSVRGLLWCPRLPTDRGADRCSLAGCRTA
jgi:hypothetical protein